MIILKTSRELTCMKHAGRIAQNALKLAGSLVKPGVSTWELDKAAHDYIVGEGAVPSCLGYGGFPATCCISVNDVVVHGIPSKTKILKEGDIVSIDLCATYEGFVGDNTWTYAVGKVSDEAQRLMDTTRESLFKGIEAAKPGNRIGDVGSAVQRYAEARGYSVVRNYTGHGVGAKMHEDPSVPNYGTPGRGVRLLPGMVIAIEPMICQGTYEVKTLSDGWTTLTKDGKLAAHYEHTVAITEAGPVILTEGD